MLKNKVKTNGFSLLEILTVIAIIAITAVFMAPSWKQYGQNRELENSANLLISHLKEAQQKTVTTQVKHLIRMAVLSNGYSLIKQSQPEEILSGHFLADEVLVSQITGLQNNEAVFNAAGGADLPGDIYLTHQQTQNQIKISLHPSGYVTWEDVE